MSGFDPNIYEFEEYELDGARFELRRDGVRLHVEPQVLSLLLLLVEHRGRMVSKDEMIDKIWDGRIVSESAVAARIKAARKAVGDDGSSQKVIRTIHGKGFRFVAEVADGHDAASTQPAATAPAPISVTAEPSPPNSAQDSRPSIAVLPFQVMGEPGPHAILADALPADLISDLSRLYWLFVIARGSSFRFRGPEVDPATVGQQLKVRYCLCGTLELKGQEVTLTVELIETGSGGAIWVEKFNCGLSEIQSMRPEIESRIVSSLAVQIPHHEVKLARGRPASELDAWASFHLGLDHMYRFTQPDNARAAELFELSLARDPYFSRAIAGLSFTHFQNAFLHVGTDREVEMDAARKLANRAIEVDRMDPFAHFNLGRCSWLEGRLQDSIDWFDRATSLSPSFAQGVYNRGLVTTLAGNGKEADDDLALALELSPLDPLAYAMVSSRSLVQVQLGDFEKAAQIGAKAANMPGAHKHIELIAAFTAHLAGQAGEAQSWLSRAKRSDPDLNAETFFRSFPYAQSEARETIEKSMRELGL